jgi:glycosyltransferase involved in cell wall biosynthesis
LHRIQQSLPERIQLSVLVRVKNELNALPEFWRRLSQQSCFNQCEVVFLDSGSTDGTVEYLSSLPCTVWSIAPQEFCFGSSCNTVMSLSQAPVALLISGHVLLNQPNDLQIALDTVAPHKYAAAYFRQTPNPYLGSNAYERAFLSRRFPVTAEREPLDLTHPGSFSNAASMLTRAAWLRNPFPDVSASEDFLWAQKHLELGGKLFYLPHIEVLHSHNERAETVFRRVRINVEARGLTRSYAKAAMYCGGIFASTMRHGASVSEAWRYAFNHAKAYL